MGLWINEVKIVHGTDGGDETELTISGPLAQVDEEDPGSALADVRNALAAAFEEIVGDPVDVVFPEFE